MRALLVRKLQEDLFPFRVLEPLSIALEEFVRAPFTLDPDEQRPRIVDAAAAQLLGAGLEQAAGSAFEKQKRGVGFELRVLRGELAVARLQHAEMLPLFGRELLKHGPA